MKKSIVLMSIIALAGIMSFTSCHNGSNNPTPAPTDKVALGVKGNIQVSQDIDGLSASDTQWGENDQIGIFQFPTGTDTPVSDYSNKSYSTTDGKGTFSPTSADQTIYFPCDGSKNVDFMAYYPFKSQITADMSYPVNLADQTNLSTIDLMTSWAKSGEKDKYYNKSNPNVEFTFQHCLSKIKMDITAGNGVTPADLKGMTIALSSQQTTGSYDLKAGTLAMTGDKADLKLNTIADGTSCTGIVAPQTLPAGSYFSFILLSDPQHPVTSTIKTTAFDPGKKYIYSVTINATGVDITSSTITDWGKGNDDGEDINV